jgi:hypothetical protein
MEAITDTTIGIFATALFTGITAVVMFLGYQAARHQSAMRRPIRVSKEDYWHPDELKMHQLPPAINDNRIKRIALLRFSNRSGVDIRWSIDERNTRLFRATTTRKPSLETVRNLETKSHDGTNVALVFTLAEGDEWSSHDIKKEFQNAASILNKKYWLKIRGFTADGHKIRKLKRVELIELYAKE